MKPPPQVVNPTLDMSHFGLLSAIMPPASPANSRPGLWECVFDTGIVMYFPPALFTSLGMKFPTDDESANGFEDVTA